MRWLGERLRSCTEIVASSDLADVVRALGDPLGGILVGRHNADLVSGAVLDVAELFIVPDAWLRRVPKRAMSARAELAVRIAAPHRVASIEHRLPYERQISLPL